MVLAIGVSPILALSVAACSLQPCRPRMEAIVKLCVVSLDDSRIPTCLLSRCQGCRRLIHYFIVRLGQ